MTKEHPPEEIKNRLSNISEAIGNIALDYIVEIEADNRLLEQRGSDILKELLDKNKRCIELEKENRLLGERCNQLLKDKGNLTDELAEWKDEWQEQVQKAIDEGYARTQQTIQLTKAKEILRSLYFIIQSRIDYENNTGIADEMWRAEQFLKEIEK